MGTLRRSLIGLCLVTARVFPAQPANAAAPLTIDAPPSSALEALVTVPYSYAFTASGGTAPYTFHVKLDGNDITLGLTFNSSGELSGTPTAAGTWQFTVVVTDATLATAEYLVVMTVGVLPMTLGSTPPSQVTAFLNFTH